MLSPDEAPPDPIEVAMGVIAPTHRPSPREGYDLVNEMMAAWSLFFYLRQGHVESYSFSSCTYGDYYKHIRPNLTADAKK